VSKAKKLAAQYQRINTYMLKEWQKASKPINYTGNTEVCWEGDQEQSIKRIGS
jgi:hypothetical protein